MNAIPGKPAALGFAVPRPGSVLSAPGKDLVFLAAPAGRLRFREDIGPDAPPVPLHRHMRQTERFTVIEGALDLTVDGQVRRLGPGESLEVAPRRVHTYTPGGEPGEFALVEVELWPALDAHRFFEAIYGLSRSGGLPPRGFRAGVGISRPVPRAPFHPCRTTRAGLQRLGRVGSGPGRTPADRGLAAAVRGPRFRRILPRRRGGSGMILSHVLPARAASAWAPRGVLHLALCICLALMPLSLLSMAFDGRTLGGVSVWAKPLKFQLALALHAATLLWIFARLPGALARSPITRWVGAAVGVTILYEVAFIGIQASRGVRSHFNHATLFDEVGGSIMAFGAGVLTLAPALVGALLLWRLMRDRKVDARTPLLLAMALGLVLSAVLGGMTGSAIGANQGPYVGAAVGPFLPLTGWSLSGGDLRIAHFLGLHAMQAVPLAALALGHVLPPKSGVLAVAVFAAAWTWATLTALAAAQAGLPPI